MSGKLLVKMLLGGGLLLVVAGCDQKAKTDETPRNFTPPSLWRIEVVEDSGGKTGAVAICANPEMISSFSRVDPSVNGMPCEPKGKPAKDTPEEHVSRCMAGGAEYGLYVTTTGQRDSDFTVRFALRSLEVDNTKVVQARRYQRLGACPAGWQAGDQGPVGGKPGSNLLSGQKPAAP